MVLKYERPEAWPVILFLLPAVPIGAAGEKFSKFDNFYVFSRPKFEFLSQNLDILPKNCNFKRPKSILSSTNFYWFFADFWPKNQ